MQREKRVSLKQEIIKLIKSGGPISVSAYMGECLANPKYGYYMQQKPFGSEGDFTTSPEISQIFGELVGIWCAAAWQQMGCPKDIAIVELGPGRGLLMKDFLRGTKHINHFHESIEIHMVEVSDALTKIQQENLKEAHNNITWHKEIASLPVKPMLLVCNEFFDALPIHQYIKTEKGWSERFIALDDEDNFIFTDKPSFDLPDIYNEAKIGDIVETCPAAEVIMSEIASHIEMADGAALVIDYGYGGQKFGDSLQAMKNHQYSDIFENIGSSDLTAHVNFDALQSAASQYNVNNYKLISQRDFLVNLGIELRMQSLLKSASDGQKDEIISACERLIDPKDMGSLFKVMTITNANMTNPVGF